MDAEAIREIIGLATASNTNINDDFDVPFAIVPNGMKVQFLRELMDGPERIKKRFETCDFDSFIAYINKFGQSQNPDCHFCEVSGNGTSANIGAKYVFDGHHTNGDAGNEDHQAIFNPVISEEWKRWTSISGTFLPQTQFAEFLESNAPDIDVPENDMNAPTAAQMLTLAETISVTSSMDVDSRVDRTNGGMSFKYHEKTEAKQGSKVVEVPPHFWIRIPMHVGGPGYFIKAMFRYRRVDNVVKMGVELYRFHKCYEVAIHTLVEGIGRNLPEVQVFR